MPEIIELLNCWPAVLPALLCACGCGAWVRQGTPGEPCADCMDSLYTDLCRECGGSGRVLSESGYDEFCACPECSREARY